MLLLLDLRKGMIGFGRGLEWLGRDASLPQFFSFGIRDRSELFLTDGKSDWSGCRMKNLGVTVTIVCTGLISEKASDD